jgi:hypothetical protein
VKVKTAALGSLLALVVGGVGLSLTQGDLPFAAPRTSSEMAKPRKMKIPEDGRARVIIQMCWYPAEKKQVNIGWKLGPTTNGLTFERVGDPLNCNTPWSHTAVLSVGDSAIVSWSTLIGPIAKYKARITVNNRPRIDVSTVEGTGARQCVIGTPPCELP